MKKVWAKLNLQWQNKFFVGLLLSIIAIGILFRLIKFASLPLGLYWDEQAILIDALAGKQAGKDWLGNSIWQLIYPSYGDFKAPVYIWLATLASYLPISHAAIVRIPALVVGLLTVVVAANLAGKIINRKDNLVKLLTAAIMASSPWAIHFSRVGFEAFLGQFLVLLSAWLLTINGQLATLLAVVAGIIATYTYYSVRFVWWIVWLGFVIRKYRARPIKQVILIIVGGLILYASALLPLQHQSLFVASQQLRLSTQSVLNCCDYAIMANVLREQAGNNFIDRFIFHRHLLLLQNWLKNFSTHISWEFLFVYGDANLRHGTAQHGLFLLPLGVLWIVGIGISLKSWRKYWPILAWWLAALVPASVPMEVPHALRSLNALVPLVIIIALGGVAIWEWLLTTNKRIKFLVTSFFLSWWLISLLFFGYYYFSIYPQSSTSAWQASYSSAAELVKITQLNSNFSASSYIFVQPFDDRFFLWVLENYLVSEKSLTVTTNINNYKLKQLDNVYFSWPTAEHLALINKTQPTQEVWLLGEEEVIKSWAAEQKLVLDEASYIKNSKWLSAKLRQP